MPEGRFAMAVIHQLAERLPDQHRDASAPPAGTASPDFTYAAEALIAAYRTHGYRAAAIDPLEEPALPASRIAELQPHRYGLPLDDTVALRVELGGALHDITLAQL